MHALVSTLGRLHFVPASTGLRRNGVDADLFQGWLVKDPLHSFWLKVAAKIIGRESLIYGFTQRSTPELQGHNYGDFIGEFCQTALLRTIGRLSFSLSHWSAKVGFWIHGYRAISLVKKNKYDVVHIRSGMGRFVIPWAKKHGIKVLVDHSICSPQSIVEDVLQRKWDRTTYWWTVDQDCRDADILMVDCDYVKYSFLQSGYSADNIRVVYMGLDGKFNGLKKWDDFAPGKLGRSIDNPLRIVYTGGFSQRKGNNYFLEAIEMLMNEGVTIEVDVIGQVSVSQEIAAQFPRAMAKIHWHGHVAQDVMCNLATKAHVYLFPSLSEGCAKSAFEAMSMGLCVVATEETGLPMDDGKDGYLIKSRSASSIRETIIKLIDNPCCIKTAGLAATQRVKKYTWDFYGANVKKVYEELLTPKA